MVQALPYILYGMLGLQIIIVTLLVFEKPLRQWYFRLSDERFQRKTGIDPRQFPNPFEC